MESVDFFDKHLDPPDEPLRGECDGCGAEYFYDDMTRRGMPGLYRWLCDDCVEADDEVIDQKLDDEDMSF